MKSHIFLSLSLLLSPVFLTAGEPTITEKGFKKLEEIVHSPLGKEAITYYLSKKVGDDLVNIKGVPVLNTSNAVQIVDELVKDRETIQNAQAGKIRAAAQTATKIYVREKAVELLAQGSIKAAQAVGAPCPEAVKENSKLKLVLGIILKNITREAVDTGLNALENKYAPLK